MNECIRNRPTRRMYRIGPPLDTDHTLGVRTINGEPWFLAEDVCEMLWMFNKPGNMWDKKKEAALTEFVGEKNVMMFGRTKPALFISEGAFYRLVLLSDAPCAKYFQQWTSGEVLTSILRHGSYTINRKN